MSNGPYPMSVCYGPFHQEGKGPGSGNYSPADINYDMEIIALYFKKIRTYAVDDANQWNVQTASQHGLQVCLGAWIYPGNETGTNSQIVTAIQQAKQSPGTVVHLIVGNEVDLVSNVNEVINALNYAKTNRDGLNIPVTACFTAKALGPGAPIDWSPAINACEDVVYLTVYPFYGNCTPDNIDTCMQWSYQNGIKQVMALGKRAIIAEIGWPSAGGQNTSPNNELTNYNVTKAWVSGNNSLNLSFETFWFEMFDEPWKTGEGPQGPHWGLYGSGKTPTPKFQIPP
ncbi:MAG: hypothetical protein JO232_10065 [Verrucomicrobia bacterium]|nr:hypothetical protein [Verrucomicrobiota bacterium]